MSKEFTLYKIIGLTYYFKCGKQNIYIKFTYEQDYKIGDKYRFVIA